MLQPSHASADVPFFYCQVRNELRERVVVRVDGGIRNGRDILTTAALGADEYGFGTVAMIATGCIMARVCHTNNCPVGVASQREELRARFPGAPAGTPQLATFIDCHPHAGCRLCVAYYHGF